MMTTTRIDPRIRALGKARIDVTRRAQDEVDFQRMWQPPRYEFPFKWGPGLKQCIQYVVDDFAAEVGFYIDVLGFPVSAFSPNYAQFTSPGEEVYFGVVAAPPGAPTTSPETLRIQFAVREVHTVIQELEGRGVIFELKPEVDDAVVPYAVFRTPHGVGVELLGIIEPAPMPPVKRPAAIKPAAAPLPERDLQDSLDAFWEEEFPDKEPAVDESTPALLEDGDAEQAEQVATSVETLAEPSAAGAPFLDDEITYEDIIEEEDDTVAAEPTYEDVEEPARPVSVLPVKPRPTTGTPAPQPAPRSRRLDIHLPPARLTRSRRTRSVRSPGSASSTNER